MSKLRLYGATSGYKDLVVPAVSDNAELNLGNFVSNNYLDSGVTTLTDAQGNVRALERTAITSTPYDFPAASSGKYFVCNENSLTVNIDGADISMGDIFTFWAFPNNGDVTISWTNMTNGVYIAGDTNNKGTSGSITLAAGGLCTVICDTDTRMLFNGNVS